MSQDSTASRRALEIAQDLRARGLTEDAARVVDLSALCIEAESRTRPHQDTGHESLYADAIQAVRDLLNACDVPPASFIDDHVGNAIFQRNKLIAALREVRQTVEDSPGFSGRKDILKHIDKAFSEAKIANEEIANVQEAQGDP